MACAISTQNYEKNSNEVESVVLILIFYQSVIILLGCSHDAGAHCTACAEYVLYVDEVQRVGHDSRGRTRSQAL